MLPQGSGVVLRTAATGILLGISRSIVLEVAAELAEEFRGLLSVSLEPVGVDRAGDLSEAFITSASRGVVPVVSIDGRLVGQGRPGEWTGRIADRYEARAEERAEPL